MNKPRLEGQIAFLLEIDKLKNIYRRSLLIDGKRRENDAEHSWHFAMFALVLAEYSNEPNLDLLKVLKMAVIHDLVEIYAGDTYIYDDKGRETQEAREREAADKLFGILPEDQAGEFLSLWREFEEKITKEARFAGALDRLQPLLLNYHSGGISWKEHGVTEDMVVTVNSKIQQGSEELWTYAKGIIREAVEKEFIK